jgi:hypothetical protein
MIVLVLTAGSEHVEGRVVRRSLDFGLLFQESPVVWQLSCS